VPRQKILEMSVDLLSVLDPEGNVDESLEPALDNEMLEKFYRTMMLTRLFDDKAIKLSASGQDAYLWLVSRAGGKPDRKRLCHEAG